MSVYIDRKFLGFVSSKLEQYKQKNTDLYNFRCPYCGDSQKNKLKARGYVYRKSNDYFFICHNCGKSTTFAKFLEHVDGTTYKQYILERYATGQTGYGSNVKKPDFEQLKGNAVWGGNDPIEAVQWLRRSPINSRLLVSGWDAEGEDAMLVGQPLDITKIVFATLAGVL